jgi:hypothetical protein
MKLQKCGTKLECRVCCRKYLFVVIILHSHESILLNSWEFYSSCIWRRRAKYEYEVRSICNTRLCRIILYSISFMASLITAVDKGCIGWCRLSLRYTCCVREDDKRYTFYIEFITWNVPFNVIVCAVIWHLSKLNILFEILLLLMQFRKILNNVKGGEEEEKEEESQKRRIMK